MKDIVENRSRISLGHKIRLARIALRQNGLLWCTLLAIYLTASSLAHRAFGAMDRMRRAQGVPGMNSAELNKEIWDAWNWDAGGEEWTQSDAWKDSLIRCVLEPNVPTGASVVEIGPGAGRWTVPLLARSRDYLGIDISAACIAHCRKRFAAEPHARFEVGSGRDLASATDSSADAIWSFDVFVHINQAEVAGYAAEFARVLRPGGFAVIHHGGVGGAGGGWRSDLTASAMDELLARCNLHVERAFSHWSDGETTHELAYGDRITILSKPAIEGVAT